MISVKQTTAEMPHTTSTLDSIFPADIFDSKVVIESTRRSLGDSQ